MIRRRLIVIGAAFIIVVVLVILIGSGRGEPRYQGRALSKWIEDARIAEWKSNNGYYQLDPKWQAASNALAHIGTNAVPTLVKWAFAKDSKPMTVFIERIGSHVNLGRWLRDAAVWQTIAAYGFELLGDKVEFAWPALEQHTHSKDAKERALALQWLDFTSSANSVVPFPRKTNAFLLPTALRLFKDPDYDVQHRAVLILAQEYPKEADAAGVFKMFPGMTNLIPTESATNRPVVK